MKCSNINENDFTVGGRLRAHYQKWCNLTSDPFILSAIRGYEIEFAEIPVQLRPPSPYKRNAVDFDNINEEVKKLFKKGVIEPCSHEEGEFISNIFSRPKKNGGTRIILDLSELNKCLNCQHFKMDNIHTATYLISSNCYLASVDLRDAYYSVPIHSKHRKFLKFVWNQKMWQFKVLPNGLSTAPRLFTKLLKPVFSELRRNGHTVVGYLDDTLIIGKDRQRTMEATKATTSLLTELGFIIHPEKSVLTPTRKLQFLGFELDTEKMIKQIPNTKMHEIVKECNDLLSTNEPTIRRVAMVIGKLIATFPAVQYGPLHYRALEKAKIMALQYNKGHFDRKMTLTQEAKSELKWWITNLGSAFSPIVKDKPSLELRTDASGAGWGATNLTSSTGGRWSTEDIMQAQSSGINYLEILAAGLGLKALCSDVHDTHILMRLDNTTAVAYLKNMGGTKSPDCNRAAKDIWEWCIERNNWITPTYLPGKQNTEADNYSRKFNDRTEWMLDEEVFNNIVGRLGQPEIDLFASRLNNKVDKYVSWSADPGAVAIDAFTVDWQSLYFYAFPPFCLISKCLQKIKNESASGIMVVPNWPSQPWYPVLMDMTLEQPMFIPKSKSLLVQPVTNEPHPLNHCLDLLCCRF